VAVKAATCEPSSRPDRTPGVDGPAPNNKPRPVSQWPQGDPGRAHTQPARPRISVLLEEDPIAANAEAQEANELAAG
jgi:hypothetical protein